VLGEVQRDPGRVLGAQGGPHPLEVGQAAGGEPITGRGLDIDLVERGKVAGIALADGDPGLRGLLDVAPPELVEPGQQLGLRAPREGHLEHVARLHVAESGSGRGLLGPSHGLQHVGGGQGAAVGLVRGEVAQGCGLAGGDGVLEGGRPPAPGPDRWADLGGEGSGGLQVGQHRVQPVGQGMHLLRCPDDPAGGRALAEPVDVRALGQVRQVAREPGDLAVQDQAGTDQGLAVEPPEGLVAPVGLHRRPRGDLQGTDEPGALRACGDVGQVLLSGDRPDAQGHGPRLPTRSRCARPGGALGRRFRHHGSRGIPCSSLGTPWAVDSHWRMSDPHVTIRDRGSGRAQGAATLLSRMDRDRLSPKEVGS